MSFWRRLFGLAEEEEHMTMNVNDEEQSTRSRRALLSLGAAAAGVLAGTVLKPEQANAHAGPGIDPAVLHLGHDNAAASGTQLVSATTIPTLHVTNTATGVAVTGQTDSNPVVAQLVAGVHGLALHTTGVFGHSFERIGVGGFTDGAPLPGEPVAGVHGVAPNAAGVLGFSQNGVGVQAVSPDGIALDVVGHARFSEDLEVNGTVTIQRVGLPVKTGIVRTKLRVSR